MNCCGNRGALHSCNPAYITGNLGFLRPSTAYAILYGVEAVNQEAVEAFTGQSSASLVCPGDVRDGISGEVSERLMVTVLKTVRR